jgi:DNA-directed RNA polymerase specialized sigma24 family protein
VWHFQGSERSFKVEGMLTAELTSLHIATQDSANRAAVPPQRRASYEAFVREAEPRLRAALVTIYGTENGRDATAEALAYAWEHWERLAGVENRLGYLFRVAQSKSRRRRTPVLFVVPETGDHDFEPGLPKALLALSDQQRVAVVLVHGFGFAVPEVAQLLGIRPTSVRNHVQRGLRRLRRELGVSGER